MQYYQVLSALLLYPEPELVAALPELATALDHTPRMRTALRPLFDHLADKDMITLQQEYVQTFDRTPGHSLHLFEHIHGESRDRGQAMVDLMEEYKKHGLEMTGDELPDFVPLFLEYLSQQDSEDAAGRLLGDAVHVLAHVGRKLAANGSVYACLFDVLEGSARSQRKRSPSPRSRTWTRPWKPSGRARTASNRCSRRRRAVRNRSTLPARHAPPGARRRLNGGMSRRPS